MKETSGEPIMLSLTKRVTSDPGDEDPRTATGRSTDQMRSDCLGRTNGSTDDRLPQVANGSTDDRLPQVVIKNGRGHQHGDAQGGDGGSDLGLGAVVDGNYQASGKSHPQAANGRLSGGSGQKENKTISDMDDEDHDTTQAGRTGCCGRRKATEETPSIGVMELFRFATSWDKLLMVIGTLGALGQGSALPVNMAVLGEVINTYVTANSTSNEFDTILDDVKIYIYMFVALGVATLICGYISVSCWQRACESQVNEIRKQYFDSVIRQNIGWFDVHEAAEISTYFSGDIAKIGEGIGEKMALFIQWSGTACAAYIMAFSREWRLTLCLMIFSPFVIALGGGFTKALRGFVMKEFKAYAKAGAVAEQAFRSIRTVQAFQGQGKETERYKENLSDAVKMASKKGVFLGIAQSALWFVFFIMFSVMLWLGVLFIQKFDKSAGDILPVFLGILIGSLSIGHAFNNMETFVNAKGAAAKIFPLIFLKPEIDTMSEEGLKPKSFKGNIRLTNILFSYPARPDVQILKSLDIEIKEGQHVALVGPSGCGKSTIIQLVQRFYDPSCGQVFIDGHDLKNLNLKWFRAHIGVVSQEPVLFDASIADNIRFGKLNASHKEIEQAAKDANAHDFIQLLPMGYSTSIGERGAQLSGGQKQRIAIARALIRNPKILLLDEATSALDHESEAVVQNALDKAEEGRTTITVAHRLSTVRNADKIIAISEGEVVEDGTHDELMASEGLYYQLVKLQDKLEKETDIALEENIGHLHFHQQHSFLPTGSDIDDIEIVEEDEDENCTAEKELLRASFRRSHSRESKEYLKSAEKEVALVAMDSKRRHGGKNKSSTKQKEPKEVEEEIKEVKLTRIMRYNAPEWNLIMLGCLGSMLAGVVHPFFSFMMSEFINIVGDPDNDHDEQWEKTHILAGAVIGGAFFSAIFRMLQGYCFQRSGALLTARLRHLSFDSIINQDIGYFDLPHNQVGALTSRLSSDASLVQGATGSKVGQILEALSCLACAIGIAFYYGWKLAFVVVTFLPFMIIAGFVQGKVIAGASKKEKGQLLEASKVCSEVVDNIRTVTSLGRGDYFSNRLHQLVAIHKKKGIKTSHLFGLTYGIANSLIFFAYAASFYYGSVLINDGEMEFFSVFRVFTAVIFGGTMIGRQSSFAADYAKARVAASRVIALIDQKPKIDVRQTVGIKMNNFQGAISLVDTVFHYSTRPTIAVLDGMNLNINPGEKVALVGASGCGKSTTIQLVERFYEPDSGSVVADGTDLRKINLQWYRYQIGIVSQEPILFDCSIAENIAYGDNSRLIPMQEIIEAAKAANIHTFISSLPQGYDTSVGDKGTQLSGGQKQRISIARALVRNPKILLLDEATSALDTESEKIVQEALDRASQQRTCIIIAHRLSTIQNADKIAVVSKGKIIEMGTHTKLMTIKGAYYRLQKAQNRTKKT